MPKLNGRLLPTAALVATGLLVLGTTACAPKEEVVIPTEETAAGAPEPPEPVAEPLEAVAALVAQAGSEVSGQVTFAEVEGGVQITADVFGVSPGRHGFHLHQVGDCSAADFTSAGGHFNPMESEHGAPGAEPSHAGDLGNLEIGEDGSGHLEWISTALTIAAGPASVVDRSVILHEGEDDLTTQPTGNAGARVACGVVALIDPGDAEGESDEAAAEGEAAVDAAGEGAAATTE